MCVWDVFNEVLTYLFTSCSWTEDEATNCDDRGNTTSTVDRALLPCYEKKLLIPTPPPPPPGRQTIEQTDATASQHNLYLNGCTYVQF